MRLVTTSDGTSVTVTGLSVFASAKSPRITRPPCVGWPAAGAVVRAGAAGAFVAGVRWGAGALVAAGGLPGGADVGGACTPGAPAASMITLAVRIVTNPAHVV